MWVPLAWNNEFNGPGADYFVQKTMDLASLYEGSRSDDNIILDVLILVNDKIKNISASGMGVLSTKFVSDGLQVCGI